MRRSIVALATVLTVLVVAADASAQWFLDGYVGASLTSEDDVTFETFGIERKQDANYRSSALFGVRLGKWFEQLPWLGVAADVSYFRPSGDINVFPLTALVMARYGFLRDEEFRDGRLQPYAGIGAGLFISHLDGAIGFVEGSDTSVDMGFDMRLGVAYRVDASWAAFFEYRFTHVSPTFALEPFGGTTDGDTTFNTNHFVLGLSYRF
jgi:opacity protein-like surface antigen